MAPIISANRYVCDLLIIAILLITAPSAAQDNATVRTQSLLESLGSEKARPGLDSPFLLPGDLASPLITLPPNVRSPAQLLSKLPTIGGPGPALPDPPPFTMSELYAASPVQWAFQLKGFSGGTPQEHCTASAIEMNGTIRIYTALHCVVDARLQFFPEFLLIRPEATPQVLRIAIGTHKGGARVLQSSASATALSAARLNGVAKDKYFLKRIGAVNDWAEDGCALEIPLEAWPALTWNRMIGTPTCAEPGTSPGASVWGVLGGCNSPSDCVLASAYQLYRLPFRVSSSEQVMPTPWLAVDIIDNSQIMGGDSGGPIMTRDSTIDRLCAVVVATRGRTAYSYRVSF